jgi:predicted CoA-binding protein
MNLKELLNTQNIFAVVGASNDEEKYGYKVYKMLKSKGYEVYPVNAKRDVIQEDKAYPTLKSLPTLPNVISVVTPPVVSKVILQEAFLLGIKNIWFQPGAADDDIVSEGLSLGMNVIYGPCILVEMAKM